MSGEKTSTDAAQKLKIRRAFLRFCPFFRRKPPGSRLCRIKGTALKRKGGPYAFLKGKIMLYLSWTVEWDCLL